MSRFKRLSDMEYMVMSAIWSHEPPVTTGMIMDTIGAEKNWKVPTLISYLNRLAEKGFVRSEKQSRERWYYPLVEEKEYLEFETNLFLKTYHHGSLTSLVSTLYDGKQMKKEDIDQIRDWMEDNGHA